MNSFAFSFLFLIFAAKLLKMWGIVMPTWQTVSEY